MTLLLESGVAEDRKLVRNAFREAAAIAPPTDDDSSGGRDFCVPGYSLVQEISRGGQGIVYEAIQESTGRRVAVKVTAARRLHDAVERARFSREVRVLSHLSHPNIVTIHDGGEIGDRIFYSMELIDGLPVDRFVRERSPSRQAVLQLFASICDGVHAAHQRGIIHRDLKPANILVGADGHPKVLDFGLAHELLGRDDETALRVTRTGEFLGTLRWASPEQLSGSAHEADVRSDVYSLGLILYELLTQAFPYETAGPAPQTIEQILHAQPRRPSRTGASVDHDLDTIVLRCLAKEPDRRYAAVADVAEDIRRYLRGDAIEAKRDSRLYVLGKTFRRYRWAVLLILGSALAGIGFGVVMAGMYQEAESGKQQAEAKARQLQEQLDQLKQSLLEPANWTSAFDAARRLKALPPEEGLALLDDAWRRMDDVHRRQQLLKAVAVSDHPKSLHVFHWGMTDASPDVQNWAISYLRETAYRDFAEDFRAYEAWHEKYGAMDLEDAKRANLEAALKHLRGVSVVQRAAQMRMIADGLSPAVVESADASLETGLAELAMDGLSSPEATPETIRAAGALLRQMPLKEPFLRNRILPLLRDARTDDELRREIHSTAADVLGQQKAGWAVDPLLQLLVEQFQRDRGTSLDDIAEALAEIGDPRVIPTMIAIIDADNTYDTVYGVGYFGLGKMTGVRYDESHDGPWWRNWWENNRQRFGDEVAAMDIPAITTPAGEKRPEQTSSAGRNQDAEADDVTTQSLAAGGNDRMQFFLYGPRHPDDPKKPIGLILVMPGGDGSADFQPFVKRLYRRAVPDQYLLAQLVAPRWSDEQFKQVVWPTTKLPFKEAKFTTEEFVKAVIEDVKRRHKLDEQRIFTFGWSSGGPPAYAAALDPDCPVRGAFVAMSVFKPEVLPDLKNAAGKRFYILHSRADFIAMRFPEAARDELAEAGAATKLATYEGGHGWHGNVYGNIRAAFDWLSAAEKSDGAGEK